MGLITLTTDFGLKDYAVSAVKGAIYSILPGVRLVDISHKIAPFNVMEAAYIVKNAYKFFPEGSVHLLGVDSEWTPENRHLGISFDRHYFVCADNGIMNLICNDFKPDKIVELSIQEEIYPAFPFLEVFVKVGCHLARGGNLDVVGKTADRLKPIKEFKPFVNIEENQILGSVVYVDNYGNAITNISKKLFDAHRKGRRFEVSARNYTFNIIYRKYSEVINFDLPPEKRFVEGKRLALFNTAGQLEIALYKSDRERGGSASTLLGLKQMETVSVRFF